MRFTCSWLVLRLLCVFRVCTYHVNNNYVTYIVAKRHYLSRLQPFRGLLCVATVSSLVQLRVRDGYWEAEAFAVVFVACRVPPHSEPRTVQYICFALCYLCCYSCVIYLFCFLFWLFGYTVNTTIICYWWILCTCSAQNWHIRPRVREIAKQGTIKVCS